MGCGDSKLDDSPLVILSRERKELIKGAADHRYALSSAHISYFNSMKDVGDALRRFVDEKLVIPSPSASPVLTLPSEKGKNREKKNNITYMNNNNNHTGSTSNTSSSSNSNSILYNHYLENEDSHLHLSSDSESGSLSGHIHIHDSPEVETNWDPYEMNPPNQTGWGPYGVNPLFQTGWESYGGNSNSYAYYMKRSSPAIRTVIHQEEPRKLDQSYVYSNSYPSYPNENGGFFGFPVGSPPREPYENQQPSTHPPLPPSPRVSAWDFINPFDGYDNGYPGYYSQSRNWYGSIASSPDSNEVREREGIPDLEEETENEVFREVHKVKKLNQERKSNLGEGTYRAVPRPPRNSDDSLRAVPSHSSEGSTRGMPSQNSEDTPRGGPLQNSEATHSVHVKEGKSSPDTIVSKGTEDEHVKKQGVSFEVDQVSTHDVESSKLSSLTTLSFHGTRDLQEVVNEIRDEFEMASSYGKEVAVMLEVGKLPYQPRFAILKVVLSRIRQLIAPSFSSDPPLRSIRLASRKMKLARSYFGDNGKGYNMNPSNLSSTLERLYAWENKLYKEIKDEERLRVIYEKMCKRQKVLDHLGAESSKIDATQASIRRLLIKLNVCIKAIDAISIRIHKLRDEELQPQVTELIHGLVRMWKLMLKCHQKQFQAIMQSKTQTLKANTCFRRDSSMRATCELELELLSWCNHFSDWINTQKSYVESLNGWLLRCLHFTPDGIVPFSPSQIGAPPIFIILNDWYQAMEMISKTAVANAIRNFSANLRQIWERQDEEQRQRPKAENLSEDFKKQIRTLRMERGILERDQDAMSDKNNVSIVPSESGVSSHDDLKVDLDSIRKRLHEERARHMDAFKLVHDSASSSLQRGLVPIFKALENFTSDVLKAHGQVRIQNSEQA